jgi:hypothetical protein
MDRDAIYNALFRGIDLYRTSIESGVYEDNKFDLLQKVSALTDAVFHEKLSLVEGVRLLGNHIESIRAARNAPPPEAQPDTGTIKF